MREDEEVRVSFNDFWPGFSPYAFFLPFVSQALCASVVLSDRMDADLSFTSVFQSYPTLRRGARWLARKSGWFRSPRAMSTQRARKHIWYTGENQRPPLEDFDLSYSFDVDSYGGTNVYLPLILTGLDWFVDGQVANSLEGKRAGKTTTPSMAWKQRETDVAERMEFACAFIGNPEPTRLRAIQELSKIGQVDVYGTAVNRPVREKFSVAKRYRYMLCFENDLYPGYITEKPLDAWIGGCIPLWRGIDSAGLLNTKGTDAGLGDT